MDEYSVDLWVEVIVNERWEAARIRTREKRGITVQLNNDDKMYIENTQHIRILGSGRAVTPDLQLVFKLV